MSPKSKSPKPLPIQSLHYLHGQQKLWLNPEYQRESVWRTSQKQLLIDSLLREIDIPKLYFREIHRDPYQYEVVDGQQRLRAIFEFLEGGYKMPDDSDPVDGYARAGQVFRDLHTDLQLKLHSVPLDVVIMNDAYTDDDIEEMFLRLQNGTPLNAAEKRRAIAGNMRVVVRELAEHPVFKLCAFKSTRFAYEDQVAKLLHLLLTGDITDIRPTSIAKTYEDHADLSSKSPSAVRLTRTFNFLVRAFKDKPNPKLKKYALISVGFASADLLERYDLANHGDEFANAYLAFDLKRNQNEEEPEERQDPRLAAYTDAARADSIQDLRYRDAIIKEAVLLGVPDLVLKDPTRGFTDEQRHAIYLLGDAVCAICGATCDAADFHADHVVPHSRGGATKIANGQLLCATCNLKKSAS